MTKTVCLAHDALGDAHVQAPHDEGGGNIRVADFCPDVVPAIEHEEQHEVGGVLCDYQDDDPIQNVEGHLSHENAQVMI